MGIGTNPLTDRSARDAAAEFATHPAYPLLPFLPISAWQKGGVGIALAAVSWGIFFAGSLLVGLAGAAAVAIWFFVLDLATPSAVSRWLFSRRCWSWAHRSSTPSNRGSFSAGILWLCW